MGRDRLQPAGGDEGEELRVISGEEPGQEAVLDRLLDLLLVSVLRNWSSRPESGAPAWYRAQSDPVVGRALRMLHNQPAHPWTVASLAAAVGASRAALARRFTELVGEPPMTFLTGWRLALAADLLAQSDATVAAVAREVGYGSAFALSTAFKRVRGISPTEHRAAAGGLSAGGDEGRPRPQDGASRPARDAMAKDDGRRSGGAPPLTPVPSILAR